MKRCLDIILSLIGLTVLAPAMFGVALAIWLEDRGPILFRQIRVGRKGRLFKIYKFRSMVVNADKKGGYSTAAGDPRITSTGRFIRRTSIDELPQLLNVLKGEMSIVGPRPDVPAQESNYSAGDWQLRLSVRPGLTGLAQASKRSMATAEERTAMDLTYAHSASLWFDIKIILMTIRQITRKAGN